MINRILPVAVREDKLNLGIDESQASGLGKLSINWDVGGLAWSRFCEKDQNQRGILLG